MIGIRGNLLVIGCVISLFLAKFKRYGNSYLSIIMTLLENRRSACSSEWLSFDIKSNR